MKPSLRTPKHGWPRISLVALAVMVDVVEDYLILTLKGVGYTKEAGLAQELADCLKERLEEPKAPKKEAMPPILRFTYIENGQTTFKDIALRDSSLRFHDVLDTFLRNRRSETDDTLSVNEILDQIIRIEKLYWTSPSGERL